MYRVFLPICSGMPRLLVGAAGGSYISPPGPNFTTQQLLIPCKGLPQDKDPEFQKRMAPVIRKLNFPKIKARRARPRPHRAVPATFKSLKIGYKLGQPRSPPSLEYSPHYLLHAGTGNSPRKLSGAQTRVTRLKARNRALEGLEHTFMAELELPAD